MSEQSDIECSECGAWGHAGPDCSLREPEARAVDEVFIVERVDYDEHDNIAVFSTLERAQASVRSTKGEPVTWKRCGRSEAEYYWEAQGTGRTDSIIIDRYEVDPGHE